MPNYQTECLRAVTLAYLESFIGTEVQNSTNGSILYVNRGGRPSTYCPTYAELTGGTFIQNWQQGSTPKGDRDGIVVGGSYEASQLVRQQDLSMKYTRFNTLSISRSGSGNLSECGGNETLSYAYNYNRYTKSMNSTTCATGTSSTNVTSVCSELTYHTTYGSVTNCTSYSIGKNGSISASSRSDSIYASVSFRGTNHNSNTVTIAQNALTGSYSVFDNNIPTGCTARATTSTSFGCEGGTYGAEATGYYNIQKHWKDSCGTEYTSLTAITGSGSESAGSKSGTFSQKSCPTVSCADSATLSFTYGGYSDSVSFSQTGTNAADDIEVKSATVTGVNQILLNVGKANNKKVILSYNNGAADYAVECNGDTVLYNSEVRSSSRSYQNISHASIGSCTTSTYDGGEDTGVFKNCTSLTGVDFSYNVTTLGYGTFQGCSNLRSVHIPSSITNFGHAVFQDCTSLSSVTFEGQRVEYLGIQTFANCTSLTEIVLPPRATTYATRDLGYILFENCINLRRVTFPANSEYKEIDGSFSGCSSLIDINIPDTIETVFEDSFNGCSSLTALTFSSNLTGFGRRACSGCTNLTSFTCYATTPPKVGSFDGGYRRCSSDCKIFDGCNNLTIYVPSESVASYKVADGWKDYADRIQAIP